MCVAINNAFSSFVVFLWMNVICSCGLRVVPRFKSGLLIFISRIKRGDGSKMDLELKI